ncbi:putative flavoprotein WrbA-like [Capsicum annuum]|nr:putative flavoprotein WrbA-like [Capsicum annuum]
MIEESLNLCVGEGIRDNSATGGDEGLIKVPKVLVDIVGLVMGSVYLDCAFDVNAFWVLDVSGRGAADVGLGSIGKR